MMKNKLAKRILAGVLSFAVAVLGFVCVPDEAQAAGTSALEWQVVDNATFAKKIAAHEAPAYVKEDGDTTNAGYLFAGWFDAKEGNSITSADGITGDVYAKFIPASLTGIACQIDTNADATMRNMRLVSLIDSNNYTALGFNIYGRYDADGNGTNETEWVMYKYGTENAAQTINVYSGLYQYVEVDGVEQKQEKTPKQVFGDAADGFLFTTVSITDIPSDFFNATMAVQPYWVTKDGTYVEGMGEFNRISDYGTDTVVRNVSVNIKNATEIAAGMLDIKLPQGFESFSIEVENGRVFDEMANVNDAGVIRCIGNVADITKNVEGLEANSVFVNLRITTPKTSNITLGENTFEVSIPEIGGFSTNKEEEATASVWDVLY